MKNHLRYVCATNGKTRLIYTVLGVTLVALLFVHTADALTTEAQTLVEGKFKVMNPAEKQAGDVINSLMFEDAVITIDKNGKVSGQADTSYSNFLFFHN